MPNVSPKRYQKWLQVRADDELLRALDELREPLRPTPTRSDLVRTLIYEAVRKNAARPERRGRKT